MVTLSYILEVKYLASQNVETIRKWPEVEFCTWLRVTLYLALFCHGWGTRIIFYFLLYHHSISTIQFCHIMVG